MMISCWKKLFIELALIKKPESSQYFLSCRSKEKTTILEQIKLIFFNITIFYLFFFFILHFFFFLLKLTDFLWNWMPLKNLCEFASDFFPSKLFKKPESNFKLFRILKITFRREIIILLLEFSPKDFTNKFVKQIMKIKTKWLPERIITSNYRE